MWATKKKKVKKNQRGNRNLTCHGGKKEPARVRRVKDGTNRISNPIEWQSPANGLLSSDPTSTPALSLRYLSANTQANYRVMT